MKPFARRRCLLALLAAAAATLPATAQQPAPQIHMIYMGGDDCPPCVAWRREQLPLLQQSALFRSIRFSYVNKSIRSAVPVTWLLPDEVKPYKDALDRANGGNIGSPQTAIVVDGKVYDYFWGARAAPDIENMIAAIRNRTPYPYPRCVRRAPHWACEDGG
jgi:hypothetical protein